MSLSALANLAMSRRSEITPVNAVPSSVGELVSATSGTPETRTGVGGALQVIVTYIPTEIVALYTSIATAIQTPVGAPADNYLTAQWIAFGVCFAMTPISIWLLYAGKVRLSGKPMPWSYSQWPLWEMCASTIAFTAWAFSMPSTPFRSIPWLYSPGIAAIVLPSAATLLGLIAPVFQYPLTPRVPNLSTPPTTNTAPVTTTPIPTTPVTTTISAPTSVGGQIPAAPHDH